MCLKTRLCLSDIPGRIVCPAASASNGSAIRRLNGAGSLRRSDSTLNNCSVTKGQIGNSVQSTFELKPAAGNGIFGCGDRGQKAPIKYVVARGDKEYGKEPAENPRRKDPFRDSRAN